MVKFPELQIEYSVKGQKLIFANFQPHLLRFVNSPEGRDYIFKKINLKFELEIAEIGRNHIVEDLKDKNYKATFFSGQPFTNILYPLIQKAAYMQLNYNPLADFVDALKYYAGYNVPGKFPKIYEEEILQGYDPLLYKFLYQNLGFHFTTSTFNPAAGANSPVDGRVGRSTVGEPFLTLRNGAGNVAEPAGTSDSSPGFNEVGGSAWGTMVRSLFAFDTSSIPDSAVISTATFSAYVNSVHTGDNFGFGLYLGTLGSFSNLVNSDYQGNVSNSTKYSDTETGAASITPNAYYDQLLNASGIANINLTGITVFSQRIGPDATGIAPTWTGNDTTYFLNYADDGTNIPKLVITYSVSSPSASVSASVSPSASRSPSSSASASISPSASRSPSASISPSSSFSASISPSSSVSPSASVSPSISPSSSASLSPSSSSSPSASRSPSASVSPSISPSGSISASTSPSSSNSPSISSSVSPSPSKGYSLYSRGDELILPAGNNDLEHLYSELDEEKVVREDLTRIGQTAQLQYMIHEFKNFVGDKSKAELQWVGRSTLAPALSTVYLQIYNQSTDLWENIDSNNTAHADKEFELTAVINRLANYKDDQEIITCRTYQLAI